MVTGVEVTAVRIDSVGSFQSWIAVGQSLCGDNSIFAEAGQLSDGLAQNYWWPVIKDTIAVLK